MPKSPRAFFLTVLLGIALLGGPLGTAWAKDPPMVSIGGILVDENGAPVKGVKVSLHWDAPMGQKSWAETTTDDAGHWQENIPKTITQISWTLQHKEFALKNCGNWLSVTDELLAGNMRHVIQHGACIQGAVVDEAGAPVKEAVIIRDFTGIENLTDYRKKIGTGEVQNAVIADAGGKFSIPMETGKNTPIYVFAENFAPQQLHIKGGNTELRMVLRKGLTWSGTVRDASGAAMEGVLFYSNKWLIQRGQEWVSVYYYQASTDANGAFTINNLPEIGTVDFNMGKKGHFPRDLEWSATDENESEIVLYPAAEVHGRVLDAKTGRHVRRFTMDFGWSKAAHPVASFFCHDPVEFSTRAGDFSIGTNVSLGKVPGAIWLRVSAKDHYTTVVDPVNALDFAAKPLEIRMEPAPPLKGVVRSLDGKGVKDVSVALVNPDETAYIEGVSINPNVVGAPWNNTKTGRGGRFQLCPSKEPGLILALHESGWAIRPLADHKAKEPIILTPWSRLEGGLSMAGRIPDEKTYVAANVIFPEAWNAGRSIHFSLGIAADAQGRFTMDHVPSLPLKVGESRRWVTSHATDITPEPGKTTTVSFCGAHAGVVRGKLVNQAPFIDPAADATDAWHTNRPLFIAARLKDADPKDKYSNYVPLVLEDGSFLLDCLPPGDYGLEATMHAAPPKSACGRGTAVAKVTRSFTIAPDQAEPLALGELSFEALPKVQAGEMAPELQGTMLDGKAWKLSEERGAPVLLVFWATWCGPCQAEIPILRNLWKRYGESGRLKIIGLNLDYEMARAIRFLDEKGLPWPQRYAGAWSDANENTVALGVSYIPSNWLIDASGKILESKIPAEELGAVIERYLP